MAPEEYEHWLGKVRPATKADAGWAASAEGESVLAAIHARLDSTGGPAAAKQDGPAQEPTPAPGRTSRPARASGRRRGRSGWNGGGGHSGGDGWVGGWSVPRRGWALAAGLAAAGLVVGLVAIWPGQQAPSAERGALSATAGAPAANQGGGAATAPRAPSVAPTPPALSARPVAKLLSATTSCDALLSQLRKQTAAHVTAWGLPGGGSGIIRFPAAAAGSFATT
ncbi:MAG: hypothetical protein FWD74_04565, partial [Actinomycetia bacterium]|nr:hypothetical protein [Actinomycetes bacterium]